MAWAGARRYTPRVKLASPLAWLDRARRAALALVSCALVACEETPPASYPANAADAADADDPAASASYDADAYADDDPSAVTDFRSTLDPHGAWVDDPEYGTVWLPRADVVGADFTPYVTAGHWTYEGDWIWVSDYEWGWAPFHYGRWVWIEGRGWAWIPGRVYRGAWVVWSVGDGGYAYLGWSPWPPLWIWRGGAAVRIGFAVYPRYVYCPHGDVFAPVVATHVAAGPHAAVVASHMRPFAQTGARGVNAGMSAGRAPTPAHLGIDASHVARPAPGERGLARAQQFARPSSAAAMGGRAPSIPARRGGASGALHAPSQRAPSHGAPSRGAPSRGAGSRGGGGRHR